MHGCSRCRMVRMDENKINSFWTFAGHSNATFQKKNAYLWISWLFVYAWHWAKCTSSKIPLQRKKSQVPAQLSCSDPTFLFLVMKQENQTLNTLIRNKTKPEHPHTKHVDKNNKYCSLIHFQKNLCYIFVVKQDLSFILIFFLAKVGKTNQYWWL